MVVSDNKTKLTHKSGLGGEQVKFYRQHTREDFGESRMAA